MITTTLTNSIGGDLLRLDPIRVGRVPVTLGTPARYVTVVKEDEPILRVDVFAYGPDCFAFEEAILWCGVLVIGFGSHVHMVSMQDTSGVTLELGSFFCHLSVTRDYLLVASAEHLFRVERDRSVMWKSDILGIDGVVVTEVSPTTVRGKGSGTHPEAGDLSRCLWWMGVPDHASRPSA